METTQTTKTPTVGEQDEFFTMPNGNTYRTCWTFGQPYSADGRTVCAMQWKNGKFYGPVRHIKLANVVERYRARARAR